MSQTPGNDHSNPLSKVFNKIFHHDDDKARTQQAQATPRPAAPVAATPQRPVVTPTATVTPARSAQSTSAAQPAAQTPLATPTATQRTYTVKSGDSLSKIAQQAYGQANQWSAIFEANRDKISDPDKIFPGQVLVLPNLPSVH